MSQTPSSNLAHKDKGRLAALFFCPFFVLFSQLLFQKTLEFYSVPVTLVELIGVSLLGLAAGSLFSHTLKGPPIADSIFRFCMTGIGCITSVFGLCYLQLSDLLLIPFFLFSFAAGGLINSLLVEGRWFENYAIDMFGAALGFASAAYLIPLIGGERCFLLLLMALCFWACLLQRKRIFQVPLILALILSGLLCFLNSVNFIHFGAPLKYPSLTDLRAHNRNLSRKLYEENWELKHSHWSLLERIDVGESPLGKEVISFNNRLWTNVARAPEGQIQPNYFSDAKDNIVVIGVGGGQEIRDSLLSGSPARITGYELSPQVFQFMKTHPDPKVRRLYKNVRNENGRLALNHFAKESVDVISMAYPELILGSVGSLLQYEATIDTIEIFQGFFEILKPDGFIQLPISIFSDDFEFSGHQVITLKNFFRSQGKSLKDHLLIERARYSEARRLQRYNLYIAKTKSGANLAQEYIAPENRILIDGDFENGTNDKKLQKLITEENSDYHELSENYPFLATKQVLNSASIRYLSVILFLLATVTVFFLVKIRRKATARDLRALSLSAISGACYCLILVVLFKQATLYLKTHHQIYLIVIVSTLMGSATSSRLSQFSLGSLKLLPVLPLAGVVLFSFTPNLLKGINDLQPDLTTTVFLILSFFSGMIFGPILPFLISQIPKSEYREQLYFSNCFAYLSTSMVVKVVSWQVGYTLLIPVTVGGLALLSLGTAQFIRSR